jgi:hypothetical protein
MATINPTTGLKCCGRCKEDKPLTEYHRASREKCGYQQWCKACRKGHKPGERLQYFKDFYHNNPDKYLQQMYRRKYGISLEKYTQMLKEQNGVCLLCGQACNTGRRLAVDHCHTTGVVRGLLCGNCNKGLGNFQEDVGVMRKAIEYLERADANPLTSPTNA